MGLGDLFSKAGREARARERNLKGALNKYAQSPDRMAALDALAKDGSPEATLGLLKRFALFYDKTIEDEQEKDWVFETLVGKGAEIIPQLQTYMLQADSIAWPLRVLAKIVATREDELAVLRAVVDKHEPGYERDPTKKVQLLGHLGALKHADAASLLAPYLADMDETVRFAAVEALLRQKNEAAAREPLLKMFVSAEEESLRIRIRIAEGFADLGWLVGDHRDGVFAKMPEAFELDRAGHIKRKGGEAKA